jgi:hypothetical protein
MKNYSICEKQCINFIDRAIMNGDIKVIDFDAIREAIHDFTLGNDLQQYTEELEFKLIPMYAITNAGDPIFLLEFDKNASIWNVESLESGDQYLIKPDQFKQIEFNY